MPLPKLLLGNVVWSSVLLLHRPVLLLGEPEPERLVNDLATVGVRVLFDVGVHPGYQFRIKGRADLHPMPLAHLTLPSSALSDRVADKSSDTVYLVSDGFRVGRH